MKLLAGNWKMNGSLAANAALIEALKAGMAAAPCRVALCAPAVYLAQAQSLLAGSAIALGAQDVSAHEPGAYTGEVAAVMLKEFGVRYVLMGHSERRRYHCESDAVVAAKAQRALLHGLTPIVCVGETADERAAGQTEAVVQRQLAAVIAANPPSVPALVLAYEPVWAIGTGRTASPEQAQQVHAFLRAQLAAASQQADQVPILYGGSMNASNARELLAQPDIDGGLVGGAALKADQFLAMMACAG